MHGTMHGTWHNRYLAPSVLFLFTKRRSQKRGGMHGTMSPHLNTLLHRRKQCIDTNAKKQYSHNQGWGVGVVGVEDFLGGWSESQKIVLARVERWSRKNMLNSDSQSFAGMEGFLCHEQIIKVYCWP